MLEDLEKQYYDWKKDYRGNSLFFYKGSNKGDYGEPLREAIEAFLIENVVSDANITRMLIHGFVPHHIWGSNEAYRPVDYFWGRLASCCNETECLYKHLQPSDEKIKNVERMLNPFWLNEINHNFNGSHPYCYNMFSLETPNLSSHNICAAKCNSFEPNAKDENKWRVIDVLLLARMRLKKWAILKPQMSGTPSTKLTPWLPRLFPLPKGYDPNNPNIMEIAFVHNQMRDPYSDNTYYATFWSDHLEKVHVWAQDKVASVWEDNGTETGRHIPEISDDEYGADKKQKIISAKEAFSDLKLADRLKWHKTLEDHLPNFAGSLDSELAALLSKGDRGEYSGLLMSDGIYGNVTVYFTFSTEQPSSIVKYGDTPLQGTAAGVIRQQLKEIYELHQKYFRQADEIYENHEAIESLYPQKIQDALIYKKTDKQKLHEDITLSMDNYPENRFCCDLVRAVSIYCDDITDEVGRPVQVAMSFMNNIWNSVYGGVIRPHYSSFQRFQQLMRDFPDYRDHLTHCIQVFLTGTRILAWALKKEKSEKIIGENLSTARFFERLRKTFRVKPDSGEDKTIKIITGTSIAEYEKRILWYQWTMVGLLHDFALPVEKGNELINEMLKTFIGVEYKGDESKNSLKRALSENETTYQAFLTFLFNNTRYADDNAILCPILDLENPRTTLSISALAEDHGFLSAVYLFNQLFERPKKIGYWCLKEDAFETIIQTIFDKKDKNDINRYREMYRNVAEMIIIEVLDSIAKHNAFNKEYRLLGAGFPISYKYHEQFFASNSGVFGSPLPGILMLCDTISDWGRTIDFDELNQFESNVSLKHRVVDRPECQLSGVKEQNDTLEITVNYQWRLPYRNSPSHDHWCLRDIYYHLRGAMFPYTPEFNLWIGCHQDHCPFSRAHQEDFESSSKSNAKGEHPRNCIAVKNLVRFWTKVLAPQNKDLAPQDYGKTNKLKFRDNYVNLNKIKLIIHFYEHTICEGTLAEGMKEPDDEPVDR